MKKIGTMLLFSFLIAGCTQAQPDSEAPKKEAIATSSTQVNAPSFFHLSVLKDVNWEETPPSYKKNTFKRHRRKNCNG